MIRQTVRSGVLTAVAVLAFLPTAAAAADSGHAAPSSLPAAVVTQSPRPGLVPVPTRHTRALHSTKHRRHHVRGGTTGCAKRSRHSARRSVYGRGLPAVGRVATHRVRLNVRSGPGTGYRVVGHRYRNRLLALTCKTYGSRVRGNYVWYRLTHHRGYVSARYVRVGSAVPWC
ncbi:hypothetical protein [Streptomyces sp. NPDC046805]|uniref:hypothetical protein n=1 Tax=Streptomyces sp. NPDC046805 TaxID=3155134 RepID=UPI0033D27F41